VQAEKPVPLLLAGEITEKNRGLCRQTFWSAVACHRFELGAACRPFSTKGGALLHGFR